MNWKIVPFRYAGEPRKRFAVVIDDRKVVELPRHVHPIRVNVAPFVAELTASGRVATMATVLDGGKWSAFEPGRL